MKRMVVIRQQKPDNSYFIGELASDIGNCRSSTEKCYEVYLKSSQFWMNTFEVSTQFLVGFHTGNKLTRSSFKFESIFDF